MKQKQYTYGYSFHTDGSIKGEKKYLSYSAIDLWKKNKPEYRKRYYEGASGFVSPFTVFGSEVHKKIEDGELPVEIPTGCEHEVKLEANIKGVQVLGYLDILQPDTKTVIDVKTSINPWTQLMVEKLDQLTLYQLLIRENYDGAIDKKSHVLWLETQWAKQEQGTTATTSKGFTMEVTAPEQHLELTGKQQMFTRSIKKYDLKDMENTIASVAEEINSDFISYTHD